MVNTILKRQRQWGIGHLLRRNGLCFEVLELVRKMQRDKSKRKTKTVTFRQLAQWQNIRKSKEGSARPGKVEGREQQNKP